MNEQQRAANRNLHEEIRKQTEGGFVGVGAFTTRLILRQWKGALDALDALDDLMRPLPGCEHPAACVRTHGTGDSATCTCGWCADVAAAAEARERVRAGWNHLWSLATAADLPDCADCGGTGHRAGKTCDTCAGTGFAPVWLAVKSVKSVANTSGPLPPRRLPCADAGS